MMAGRRRSIKTLRRALPPTARWLALMLAGCSGETVVVFASGGAPSGAHGGGGNAATGGIGSTGGLPSGGDGGAGLSGPGSSGGVPDGGPATGGVEGLAGDDAGDQEECLDHADCPNSWVCNKPACGMGPGRCEPPPVFCPPEAVPVCGCDQVTYWNDCIRLQYGVEASTQGACSAGARPCRRGSDCRVPDASCSHLLPGGVCKPLGEPGAPDGVCWVLPPNCDQEADPLIWTPCPPPREPSPSGPTVCGSTCVALRSEIPSIPVPPDTKCR